ncbi:hypothetical protein A2U01_0046638, partial [Trifolium medium]|nr:hypothetical protein [Trifolium medium]
MVVTTRSIMENRVDSLEQRMSHMETTVEQILFKGEDAYGWLVRIERYRLNGVHTQDKVDAVILAMEDKALNWFQ